MRRSIHRMQISIGRTYHSTADVESGLIGYPQLLRWTQSFDYLVERLQSYTNEDLEEGASEVPRQSIFQSDSLKTAFGNF